MAITPQGKAWPEGEGFPAFLSCMVGDDDRVVEFGCGIGRLAGCFDVDRYVGVDISPAAIERAKRAHPSHYFEVVGVDDELPTSHVTLAHTVLLHVPDNALSAVVGRFESPRVIVSEILGRHWRRPGDPPVFNRDESDYEFAFAPRYRLAQRHAWPYPHYRDTFLTIMEFARC